MQIRPDQKAMGKMHALNTIACEVDLIYIKFNQLKITF